MNAPDIVVRERAGGGWTHAVAVPGTARRDHVGWFSTRRQAQRAVAAHVAKIKSQAKAS